MSDELRIRSNAGQSYVRALAGAWRAGVQLYDPSVWLAREHDLEEKMMRDADIAHGLQYRRHLIAGKQWQCVPADAGSKRGKVAALVATHLLGFIKDFTGARMNLARAFLSGARFAEIRGTTRVLTLPDGVAREWHVPVALVDMDKRRFRLVPNVGAAPGTPVSANWECFSITHEDWRRINEPWRYVKHVYQNDEGSLGHGRGLRDALGWWWYAKEHVFADTLDAIDRFGTGIITVKIAALRDAATGKLNTTIISDTQATLEKHRSKNILVTDKEDELDIKGLEANGSALLKDMREELRQTILTLILGANLPTGANKGGSYALAEVQENSTEAMIQFDREALEETLTDDLIGWCWRMNWRNLYELGLTEERPPRFNVLQEKREDPKQRAEVYQTMANIGLKIPVADIYETTGIRPPEGGEEVLQPPAQPMGLPGMGLGGFGAPSQGQQPQEPQKSADAAGDKGVQTQ